MDSQLPSLQHEQIKELEKKGKEAAITVQTTNEQNQRITTTVTSEYEQKQFRSHTDWRLRALSANNLMMRINHIWTNS